MEQELKVLLATWFPRCIDDRHGGFLCDFDHRWRAKGTQKKMLEFQARMTILACNAAILYPQDAELRRFARCGFEYLQNVMWDRDYGGWYRMLTRDGRVLEGARKHMHGTAYAISASALYSRLTADPGALEFANGAFNWMEAHAYDGEHGGYFTYLERDGTPILSRDQIKDCATNSDPVGTPIGYKDANSTTDMLRALADLSSVSGLELVGPRLKELFNLVCTRVVAPPGTVHMYFTPDWRPVPDLCRYGQAARTATQLAEAAARLGLAACKDTQNLLRSMADTILEYAYDTRRGGIVCAGSSFGIAHIEDLHIVMNDKFWWPQAEGLELFLIVARNGDDSAMRYYRRFLELWNYIKNYVIDPKHGGWYRVGRDCRRNAVRLPKASCWKDASHEGNALMACLRMLDEVDRLPVQGLNDDVSMWQSS
jgi:mannose/cellobiose epimerase-like protein (N-acyl-D-glucosamine 2-epimerase family)